MEQIQCQCNSSNINTWQIKSQEANPQAEPQNFQLSHTFSATKQNHNKRNTKKWNFLHNFQCSRFYCKKNKKIIFFNFPTVSQQPNITTLLNITTILNITTKLTENTWGAMVSQIYTSPPSYRCWCMELHSMVMGWGKVCFFSNIKY